MCFWRASSSSPPVTVHGHTDRLWAAFQQCTFLVFMNWAGMRIFSRLSSWMRASQDGDPELELVDTGSATVALSEDRLPQTSAHRFRVQLMSAVRTCSRMQRANVVRLDPSVQVLLLPTVADDGELAADDIDLAIRQVQSEGRVLSSLTWSALKEARPTFSPSYLEWAAEPDLFEGSIGLVFFLDLEAIAYGMVDVVRQLGFSGHVGDECDVVNVNDGTYHARISVNALVAEALWTAQGPAAVLQHRGQKLVSEFRSFQALHQGLRRHFPDTQFEPYAGALRAIGPDRTVRLDYRHLGAAFRASGVSVDTWLGRVRLDDLVAAKGQPGVLVRSPTYLKAYPDALHHERDGHVLVAVHVEEDGRTRPVLTSDADNPARFDHYDEEAHRQMSFTKFDAHVYIVEGQRQVSPERGPYTPFAIAFVGDATATLMLDPRLLRGALEGLVPSDGRVRVRATSEDVIVVACEDASDALVEATVLRAQQLERALHEDPSDKLHIDQHVQLPSLAAGFFRLVLVDDSFFDTLNEAKAQKATDPGHAALLQGLALQSVGRVEQAIPHFERAARHNNDDGDVLLALGRALLQEGEHDRALPLLESADKNLPSNAEAKNALGLAQYASGNSKRAAMAFESATELNPEEPAFWVNLGRCYFDQDRIDKAKDTVETALGLAPTSPEAHGLMALMCHRSGDELQARHHAREALSEEPDDPTMLALLNVLDDE